MDFHYCPVDHLDDEYIIMCARRTKKIVPINGRHYSVETMDWHCPVCDAEDILFEYSEEAYSDMG